MGSTSSQFSSDTTARWYRQLKHFPYSPANMFTSCDHTGYVVSNLDRSLHFWTDMGCKVLWQADFSPEDAARVTGVAGNGVRAATLEVPGGYNIELLEYSHAEQDKFKPQPTDLPTMHIAVTVDSIDEALLRMEKHGFKARGTPTLVQGRRIMYTEGADGEFIELLEQKPRLG